MFQSATFNHHQDQLSAGSEYDDLAVLLVNLGTPAAPTAAAVRPYLREFLWDRRVVEVPRWLWWLLLHGIVLPFRSIRSARAYQSIWMPEGSPLLYYSRQLAQQMQAELASRYPGCTVALAMTYGRPCISKALENLHQQDKHRLLLVPMYPQYSATTTAAVFDAVTRELQQYRWLPELRVVNQYYQHSEWQQAVAASIREYRQQNGSADVLLFSFHGIPKQYFHRGDPYYCQCQASARLIAQALGLHDDQWRVSFQSRLGRQPWLQPYTDHTLKALAAAGVNTVQVVCPGFATDCLETLEEIAMENAERFVDSGGESLHYIPALNDSTEHIQALSSIIARHIDGWPALQVGGGGERMQRARQLASDFGYRLPDTAALASDPRIHKASASTHCAGSEPLTVAADAAGRGHEDQAAMEARKTSHG